MSGGQSIKREIFDVKDQELLADCTLCPRECSVNRFGGADGYCGTDAGLNIASICIHRAEEPPISGPSGICNIFFAGCNLRCRYCQNYDISRSRSFIGKDYEELGKVLDIIEDILSQDVRAVGFVSPSHVVPQVRAIIKGLNSRGLKPVTVYNTNGYDKPETIRSLREMIDVWLPDFKYNSAKISSDYSDAVDYPEISFRALKEMYHLKGSSLITDDEGRAVKGILIRHLVLPGHTEESKEVLNKLAEGLSRGIHLSLMSQYHPTINVKNDPVLKRSLYKMEYESVVGEMERLGFRNGWVQDMDSNENYRPDFSKKHPFE